MDFLKDKRCITRRDRCLKRPDRESTEATQRYLRDGTPAKTYRTSLSLTGWKEKDMMLHDRIALEKHFYVATRAERIENSKHWPLNQQLDFAQAKRECKRVHDEHLARTQQDYRAIFLGVHK